MSTQPTFSLLDSWSNPIPKKRQSVHAVTSSGTHIHHKTIAGIGKEDLLNTRAKKLTEVESDFNALSKTETSREAFSEATD